MWRLISFCYHLPFHNKSERVAPGTAEITRARRSTARIYDERRASLGAVRPARAAELRRHRSAAEKRERVPEPRPDRLLQPQECVPGSSAISKATRSSRGLRRFFSCAISARGSTCFRRCVRASRAISRSWPKGRWRAKLRDAVLAGVRGGNWSDPQAPQGRAEPIYWLVCWDAAPKVPSRAVRRKHPRLDNEHVRIKDLIRSELGAGGRKVQPIVHSSDNVHEALDHLTHLGLNDHPAVLARMQKSAT